MGREKHIDVVAGLLILFMVYTHIAQLNALQDNTYLRLSRILMYYMAWFFFKSGLFYRERTRGEEVKSIWNKFLRPFLIFSILGSIIHSIHLLFLREYSITAHLFIPLQDLLWYGSLEGNKPLWFLLTLAITRTLFIFIGPRKQVLVPCVLIALGGAWLCHLYLPIPYYVGNTALAFSFFGFGYLMKGKTESKHFIIPAIITYLAFLIFLPSIFDFRTNEPIMGPYFSFAIEAIAGIIFINILIQFICRYIQPKILCFVGKHAMQLYIWHWIILEIVQIIFKDIFHKPAGWECALFMAVSCCGFLLYLAFVPQKNS